MFQLSKDDSHSLLVTTTNEMDMHVGLTLLTMQGAGIFNFCQLPNKSKPSARTSLIFGSPYLTRDEELITIKTFHFHRQTMEYYLHHPHSRRTEFNHNPNGYSKTPLWNGEWITLPQDPCNNPKTCMGVLLWLWCNSGIACDKFWYIHVISVQNYWPIPELQEILPCSINSPAFRSVCLPPPVKIVIIGTPRTNVTPHTPWCRKRTCVSHGDDLRRYRRNLWHSTQPPLHPPTNDTSCCHNIFSKQK